MRSTRLSVLRCATFLGHRNCAPATLVPRDPVCDSGQQTKYQEGVLVLWETPGCFLDDPPGGGTTVDHEAPAAFQYRGLAMASPEF